MPQPSEQNPHSPSQLLEVINPEFMAAITASDIETPDNRLVRVRRITRSNRPLIEALLLHAEATHMDESHKSAFAEGGAFLIAAMLRQQENILFESTLLSAEVAADLASAE